MAKSNLERRLAAKTQELQDIHSKYHRTEGSQAALTKQVSELQAAVGDKTVSLKAAQAEKTAVEKDLALSVAEIAKLEEKYGERIKRLQRSLHKKETDMEQRVKDLQQQIAKREQHHVVERRVAGASVQEHQVKIQEQQATITMLQSKVNVLERQIEEMMETKNDKLQQERKELKYTLTCCRRAGEEKVADLLQEKYYLETQLGVVSKDSKDP